MKFKYNLIIQRFVKMSSSIILILRTKRISSPQVLADYMALTGRELNLEEGEIVELIKIGCSGWWFVR
jgi:hypothetical protein